MTTSTPRPSVARRTQRAEVTVLGRAVVDRGARPEAQAERGLLLAADDGDDVGARGDAELDRGGADAAGRAEHGDGLARADGAAPDGGVVRGVRGDQEARGLFVAELLGHLEQLRDADGDRRPDRRTAGW